MGFPSFRNHFVNAVHNLEQDKTLEQQMQATSVAMGTLNENQVSGIVARTMASIKKQGSVEDKRKQSNRDILYQALLDQIDTLTREIADMEAGFEAEFGDAWREEIALRVLEPDEIPQQRAGESIEDYRKRLEKHLVDEMLNEDGTIKDKYKNDPELLKYAEWAQKVHNRDAAKEMANDLKDPTTTQAQTQAILNRLEQEQNAEQNTYAARALHGHEQQKDAVLDIDKKQMEDAGNHNQSSNTQGFMIPKG